MCGTVCAGGCVGYFGFGQKELKPYLNFKNVKKFSGSTEGGGSPVPIGTG